MHDKGKDLTPPEPTATDGAHSAVKSILGAIPVAGSAAVESFMMFVNPPLEKRKQKWMKDVALAIYELQNRGLSIRNLQNNNEFIDIIMYATQAALRTSQEEKLDAFKNVILNSALPNSPDISQQQIFLNYIDSFTVWHLKILDLFSNPQQWLDKNDIEFDTSKITMGNLSQLVEKAFPELNGKKDFYLQVGKDLNLKGLAGLDSFSTGMTGSGIISKRTTNIGDEFIRFIK